MDDFSAKLQTYQNGKFSFLKLYSVVLKRSEEVCELTFLYPQTMEGIDDQTRREMLEFAMQNLNLASKIRVKFKKSFLDKRLLKKQILDFFMTNFKSISAQLSDQQIEIFETENNVKIVLHLCSQVKEMYDNLFIKKQLLNELENSFIANFDIQEIDDEGYAIADEVPYVPIKVSAKKTLRYEVEPIKKLFGKDILPNPELIKNNTEPKSAVILFGTISGLTKRVFTVKNGKRKGEEKTYYTFNLNDGKTIECIYFCSKTNEKKCCALADGMPFLCLGDIKVGLSGKLTYYISSMTYAQIKTKPMDDEEDLSILDRAPVVKVEDYFDHEQSNIFSKSEKSYREPVANNDIVVYDLETTGLDPETCEIIEIGAIKIEKGTITKKFSTFVKPKSPIPADASRINHITDDMVEDAPKIEDVIVDFYNFCDGCYISGYNNTDFDNKFLKKAGQKVGLKFSNPNLDVLILARAARLRVNNFKLITVATALGVDLTNAHRAYNDAFATAKVLLKLHEIE